MIEPRPGPTVRGMALLALGSELATVPFPVVVPTMAGVTLAWRFLVVLVLVTGFTFGLHMSTY